MSRLALGNSLGNGQKSLFLRLCLKSSLTSLMIQALYLSIIIHARSRWLPQSQYRVASSGRHFSRSPESQDSSMVQGEYLLATWIIILRYNACIIRDVKELFKHN